MENMMCLITDRGNSCAEYDGPVFENRCELSLHDETQ